MSRWSNYRISQGIEVNTQKMNAAKTPEEREQWAKFRSKWLSRRRNKMGF